MPRIPDTDEAFIDFARLHIDLWIGGQAGGPDIGLTEAQLTETESATAAAEAASLLAKQARSASKAATAAKRQAIAALEDVFAADVATIDAYAMSTKDPSVYQRAQIDAPKDPSERSAPPVPTDLMTTVDTDGSIELSFKVSAGGGASYLVQRRTTSIEGVESPYQFVGMADENKRFVDTAVPDGVRSVGYRVAARISTGLQSDWSPTFTLPFGSQGGTSAAAAKDKAGSIEPVKAADQKGAG